MQGPPKKPLGRRDRTGTVPATFLFVTDLLKESRGEHENPPSSNRKNPNSCLRTQPIRAFDPFSTVLRFYGDLKNASDFDNRS